MVHKKKKEKGLISKISRAINVRPGDEYADCVMKIPWEYLMKHKDIYHIMMSPEESHEKVLIAMAEMVKKIDEDQEAEDGYGR